MEIIPSGLIERVEQLLRGHRAQFRQSLYSQSRARQLRILGFTIGQRFERKSAAEKCAAAFPNRFVKKPFGQRRCHQCAHRKRSRAFAKDRNVPRVSAERRDIILHPLQRRYLIEQTVIPRRIPPRLFRQFRMYKESKNAQAVIHGDDDHALLRQNRSILSLLRSRPRYKPSSINPDHDRQLRRRRFRGRPDIQRQAILTASGIPEDHVVKDPRLHAACAKFRGLADSSPLRWGHRRLPTQVAHRRRCVRNSEKSRDRARACFLALDQTRHGRGL